MKGMRLGVGVRLGVWVGVALFAGFGCFGNLEVGEDPEGNAGSQGKATTEGDSASAGGTGGTTSATTAQSNSASSSTSNTNTTGSGAGGSTGSWIDDITPVPAVSGSSEDCPMGPHLPDSECEPDRLSCLYRFEADSSVVYQHCYCARASGGRRTWQCSQGSGIDERCPVVPPEHGSDCYGYFGLGCVYPPGELECYCSSSEGTWDCPMQVSEEPPDPPETLDGEREVAELSDEERQAWCEWFSGLGGGPGYPPVADLPVKNGYAMGASCNINTVPCGVAVPTVSVAQCVANLSLSACEAPLEHLTGCVSAMFDGVCGPLDYACLDYVESPNCVGTIILSAETARGAGCNLRVE